MKIENIESALEIFETSALKQEQCTFEEGNARKFNKYSNDIAEAARWLYRNDLLLGLSAFYEHKSKNVKSWAASFLLEIDRSNAEKALEELADINYSDARYILMEWKAGTLNMDFFKS